MQITNQINFILLGFWDAKLLIKVLYSNLDNKSFSVANIPKNFFIYLLAVICHTNLAYYVEANPLSLVLIQC